MPPKVNWLGELTDTVIQVTSKLSLSGCSIVRHYPNRVKRTVYGSVPDRHQTEESMTQSHDIRRHRDGSIMYRAPAGAFMGRIIAFLYGLAAYLVFFFTFL